MAWINKPKKKKNNNTEKRINRQKYYQTKEWKELTKYFKMLHPICEECGKEAATQSHHIVSPFLSKWSEEERLKLLLDINNLQALCATCHTNKHVKRKKKKLEDFI